MKKLTIDRDESIAEIIDRMHEVDDGDVTLVIPKGSVLGRSVSNFHFLKREADAAQKTVLIESVDDSILAFAKEADLEASHPLWRGVRGAASGVSDIVTQAPESGRKVPVRRKKKKDEEPIRLRIPTRSDEEGEGPEERAAEEQAPESSEEPVAEEETQEDEHAARLEEEDRETEAKENQFLATGTGNFFKRSPLIGGNSSGKSLYTPPSKIPALPSREHAEAEDEEDGYRRGGSKKAWWIGGTIIVLLLVAAWVVTYFFGHATIAIDFKKNPWTHQDVFAADKSVTTANPANNVFPAQLFTTQKNTTQTFPASGSANVSIKAQGTITIFNDYSSAKQDLVATTRFVTSDGKIFRLVNSVTVPGATVTNGQIVASSVDAPIVADQAGPTYNLGPVDKLTVPGFQGTPRYNGFYGKISGTTTGGFVGKRAVPTATDIASAKTKTTAILQSSLSSDITTSYPNNFKILDGATNVTVTKLTVSTTTDDQGNFSVYGQATLQAVGFDESAFKDFLLSLAQSTEANSVFKTIDISYSNVQPDFVNGRVKFIASANGTLESAFSVDDFKASIAGKSIGDARQAIAALPDLSDGKISVWPMWLWSIPSNPAKIIVNAD